MQNSNQITITVINGKATVTSLEVAQTFGKDHAKVLRDIRSIRDESTEANFGLSEYKDESGKSNPCYILDRDGFTLLAMGFTGKKALEFKKAYIKAFNQMESKLTQTQKPSSDLDFLQGMLNALKENREQIERLESRVQTIESQPQTVQLQINKVKEYKTFKTEQLMAKYRRPISDLVVTVYGYVGAFPEMWRRARAEYLNETGEHFPHMNKANEEQLRDFLNWIKRR